jgi:hypothetical protein
MLQSKKKEQKEQLQEGWEKLGEKRARPNKKINENFGRVGEGRRRKNKNKKPLKGETRKRDSKGR